jgi:hypothetical protein
LVRVTLNPNLTFIFSGLKFPEAFPLEKGEGREFGGLPSPSLPKHLEAISPWSYE